MRAGIGLAILFSALTAGIASPQVPAGGEFQINAQSSNVWVDGSVAAAAHGDFLVAWTGYFPDFPVTAAPRPGRTPATYGTNGRLYDASGALVAEFQLRGSMNYGTPRAAFGPRSFVVTWADGGSDRDIFARQFDRSGTPGGPEFRVNGYTTGRQRQPSVAADAAGNFVVAWTDGARDGSVAGIFARRYDASGEPRGAEFQVNTYTTSTQSFPSVAGDPAGNFVIAWQSYGQDGSGYGVYARRYDAAGLPLGPEFQLDTVGSGSQSRPTVAMDPAGRFVAAWASSDGSGQGVYARRFDSSGAPVGSEFLVNTSTTGDQAYPSVTSDAGGNVAVTWGNANGVVFVRRYDSSGLPRGADFPFLTAVGGPSAASDAAGNIVAIGRRGYGFRDSALIGQRLGGVVPATLAVDSAPSQAADGNGVLEPGESVDVKPAWRNVNGATQTFDGVGLGFSGPPAGGVSYQLVDAAATYGTVANGATQQCSECYGVGVAWSGTRPSVHWDATFTERLTPDVLGQTMPWSLHVGQSFPDVPRTSLFYRDVETLLHKGVTAGCTTNSYCPGNPVTRDQMAAFVLVAKEGSGYKPRPCSPPNLFLDVPETSLFCDVIEELARRGVVGGCGGGNYCPAVAVTREQMPVFVLRLLDPALDPPACTTPMFADVPAGSPFCRWIEELARRGVVAGCGGGNYCPSAPVTRDQMAAFLTGTYGLTLYGP